MIIFNAFFSKNPANGSCRRLITLAFCVLLAGDLSGCTQKQNEKDSQLGKAKDFIESGNYEAAFVELNKALSDAPKDPNVHLNLGWLYLYTNEFTLAKKELARAETLGPELPETYHLRGSLLRYQAEQEKDTSKVKVLETAALENYQTALNKNSDNDKVYLNMATTLTTLDRGEEALDVLDKGFDHIPEKDLETQVNFQIASCAAHAQLQLYEEAVQDCQQALKYTTNPASKDRIEDMVENMKLMNPGLKTED